MAENPLTEKKNITPERAVEILRKSGMIVSIKEAKEILDLLTILAKLEVQKHLKK
jgi:hypothetical protein